MIKAILKITEFPLTAAYKKKNVKQPNRKNKTACHSTKAYAKQVRQKLAVFKAATKTKKQLFLTFLTTFPMIDNQYSIGLIDEALTMDVLFTPLA